MRTCVISAIGGESSQNVLVGNKVSFHLSDIKSKWNVFKNIGKKEFLLKTVNEIVRLPVQIDEVDLMSSTLQNIWKSPDKKIFNGIVKSLQLDEPVLIAKKNIFWKWKELIEAIIVACLQGAAAKNTLKEWTEYVKKNNIDTSSIILWAIFNEESPWYKKYFPEIEFTYLGYCPNSPDARIKALFEFPIDRLKINVADTKKIVKSISSIKKILRHQIDAECTTDIQIKKPEWPIELVQFIDIWIDYSENLRPHLEKCENNLIDRAEQINKVSQKIESIIKYILKN